MFAHLSRRGPHPRMAVHNAGARVAVGQNRPAARTANSRRRTIPTPRLLPYTIQLCIHCRHNPAGFWVSHNGAHRGPRSPPATARPRSLRSQARHLRTYHLTRGRTPDRVYLHAAVKRGRLNSQPLIVGDLISYQNNGKSSTAIVGEVDIA